MVIVFEERNEAPDIMVRQAVDIGQEKIDISSGEARSLRMIGWEAGFNFVKQCLPRDLTNPQTILEDVMRRDAGGVVEEAEHVDHLREAVHRNKGFWSIALSGRVMKGGGGGAWGSRTWMHSTLISETMRGRRVALVG
jgi:hypothetical protein